MRFRVRPSVRSLLVLVAVFAFGLALIFEIRNHSRRDDQFPYVMTYYMAANWHRREAMNCRRQSSPYPRAERLKENRSYAPGTLPAGVTSWGAEASFHEEWTERFDEKAGVALRQLEAISEKLLFP